MHVQILPRGIYSQVELWKSMIQNNFFKWKRIDKEDNKEFEVLYQGALRPSVWGTYEYIIPEEALSEFLSMTGNINPKTIGCDSTWKHKVGLKLLRKLCGVKKIPNKYYKEAEKIPHSILFEDSQRGLSHMQIPGVTLHIIGYKKDTWGEMHDPKNGKTYWQELL